MPGPSVTAAPATGAIPQPYLCDCRDVHRDGDGRGRIRQDRNGQWDDHHFSQAGSLNVSAGSNVTANAFSTATFAGSGVRRHGPYPTCGTLGTAPHPLTHRELCGHRHDHPGQLERGLWRRRLRCDRLDLELPLLHHVTPSVSEPIWEHYTWDSRPPMCEACKFLAHRLTRIAACWYGTSFHDRREFDRWPSASREPVRGGLDLQSSCSLRANSSGRWLQRRRSEHANDQQFQSGEYLTWNVSRPRAVCCDESGKKCCRG